MELEINREKKIPKFLKVVVIVGFVLIGFKIINTISGLLMPMSQSEIDEVINQLNQAANSLPSNFKKIIDEQIVLIKLIEEKYILTKLIPLICAIITLIGNILIMKRKVLGMHLVIASIIAGFSSTMLVLNASIVGVFIAIFSYFFLFIYSILVIANKKHLS